jgi:lipopolysaccharide biosynthesis protein
MRVAIFAHIFYLDQVEVFKKYFSNLKDFKTTIWISCVFDDVQLEALKITPNVFKVENRGKDIGGKLMLIEEYLNVKDKSDLMIFIHDKKSLDKDPEHVANWKSDLLKILDPINIQLAYSIFKDNPKAGMIGAKEWHMKAGNSISNVSYIKNKPVKDHPNFKGNDYHITEYVRKFNLNNFINHNYDFISGTMFIVRPNIYESFFIKYSPSDIISSLEQDDVKNNIFRNTTVRYSTRTHALERILCWIVQSQNYTVIGI